MPNYISILQGQRRLSSPCAWLVHHSQTLEALIGFILSVNVCVPMVLLGKKHESRKIINEEIIKVNEI
jgi:hypothetical protein